MVRGVTRFYRPDVKKEVSLKDTTQLGQRGIKGVLCWEKQVHHEFIGLFDQCC